MVPVYKAKIMRCAHFESSVAQIDHEMMIPRRFWRVACLSKMTMLLTHRGFHGELCKTRYSALVIETRIVLNLNGFKE